ncbi:MAG TPA: OmpH family outer membrane protein [Flavobacteriales bacterium]
MSKRSLLILIIVWNVLLTAALIWSHTRVGGAKKQVRSLAERMEAGDTSAAYTPVPRDTAGLREGRIAFFFMDSVTSGFELVEEIKGKVRSEGNRMEGNLRREMEKAQARAQELAAKDQTYSTQAQQEEDQREFQDLQRRIQELQVSSQERLEDLQVDALRRITGELQDFLGEYNEQAGFDYIFSIQEGGQVWVGNKGLDITSDIVAGLNERHRAKKTAAVPAK